jgi:tight adherence protein B
MSTTAFTLGIITAAALAIIGARLRSWASTPRRLAPATHPTRTGCPRLVRRPVAPGDVGVAAWCERIVAGVRAGSSLTRAVIDADTTTAPEQRPFPGAGLALARGRGLADALEPALDDRSGAVALLTPVMIASAELGGPAAGALERVADTLLARAAEREERRTNSAQARLSARVLTTLPFGVLAVLVLSEPSIRTTLATPAGLTCLAIGTTLNGLGWWWMRRIIGRAA